jgi:hypothetical protein
MEAENTVQGSDAIIGKLESDLLALKVGTVEVTIVVALLGKRIGDNNFHGLF